MTGNETRNTFLEFFKKHNHQIVRSSSLVPADDPTLLFTNAGMVQFKRTFLGEEKRNYLRATTSQKCVRAGGKHNDLENVGYTARHHTFFEMLGNFSFGDYFKEKAIDFAWDLIVNGYKLPADRLLVSIYLDDDEAYDLWHKNIGVPDEKIYRFGEKDNFWAMGDTGPCGPCSEIHYDRGPEYSCDSPNCELGCECDRFLEIWNLVFMQFNRDASGKMEPLPKPSIDTGMGLERMASIMQNVETNFDTDLLRPIMHRAEALSQKKLGESHDVDVALKVIADHSRAAAFLIGDGILPSNEGRGYVLRRIMRRAIRYGRNIGLTKPFLHETAKVVFDIMQPAYPDLGDASSFITSVITNEEERFSETLDNGLKLLNDTLANLKAKGETQVPGDVIFKLYDTFGFPVDIVQDVVRDSDLSLDMAGYNKAMDRQRDQSRSKIDFAQTGEAFKKLTATGFKTAFTGYGQLELACEVAVLAQEGNEVDQAAAGEDIQIVTPQTPFYGQAGGQVGDVGKIVADGLEVAVTDTIKDPTGLIIHTGKVLSGVIKKGATVTLAVDGGARGRTALNHTATHILHAVLRRVLGDHVKQAGSMVAPDRLRFDFTHFSQVTDAQLDEIERQVNDHIRANVSVETAEMDAEEAFKSGATALFEEKYGDRVRVISLSAFSKELCGGTHTRQTGDIGLFKITSEASIQSGVRRIEAVTGQGAVAYIQEREAILKDTARIVKDPPELVTQKLEKMLAHQRSLEKEIEKLKNRLASQSATSALDAVVQINGVKVLARKVDAADPASLRDVADQFREKLKSGIVVLGSVAGGKAMLIVMVTKDLTKQYHAGNIIKQVAAEVGGGGGGRPDMAQAGGSQPEKLDDALAKVPDFIKATA